MGNNPRTKPQSIQVSANVDHGTDMGCLGFLIIIGMMILGSSVESASRKVADAINRYTDKVVATQPATRAP